MSREAIDDEVAASPPERTRLLTPAEAIVVDRLHRLGLFDPHEISRMVNVPLGCIERSYRRDIGDGSQG